MNQDTTTGNLIERMFKAGAHFGFSKSRRHPSVAPYLFGSKQGFDIFDLEKTSALLADATAYMRTAGQEGKRVLMVGTKEEVADIIRTEARRAGVPFAVNRWVGGTITNFQEIKKRIERFLSLQKDQESGELDRKFTKKERLMLSRDMERLAHNFEGILEMTQTPQILFVVDPRHESIAVSEARQMNIPVVALMSSDCDVRLVEKPVILNDAHRQSVALALSELVNAYLDGKASFVPKAPAPKSAPDA